MKEGGGDYGAARRANKECGGRSIATISLQQCAAEMARLRNLLCRKGRVARLSLGVEW